MKKYGIGKIWSIIIKSVSDEQSKDAGMALVLICLLVWYFFKVEVFVALSILLLILTMIAPKVYKPFAKIWFELATTIGTVMSKILLSLIYFFIVTPVALIRKLMGADSLQLKKWKNGTESVLQSRNHTFVGKDIEKPY